MDKPKSFKRKFFRNIITLGGYNYSSKAIRFLSSAIVARLLMPEEYGIFGMVAVFANFIMVFDGAGIGADIVRSDYKRTYHKAMANLSFLIGLILFALMALLSYPIGLFYDNMTVVWPNLCLSLQFIFRGMSMAHNAILIKQMEFKYIGKVTFSANMGSIALTIIMAFLGFSYWSLIIPLVIAEFIKFYMFSRKTNLPFKIYPFSYTIAAYRKGKSILWNMIGFKGMNYWVKNLDKILIGKIYGEAPLGIYNRGNRFLDLLLTVISRLFGIVLYPSLKNLKDKRGSVHNEYLNILGVISLINFPAGLILILFPDTFVYILWGPNWMDVARFLPYFGLLAITQTMLSTIDSMFNLVNKEQYLFVTGAISSVVIAAAIALGAMESPITVIRYYTLSYIIVIIPFQLVYGFIRGLKYSLGSIIIFWGPKLLIYTGLLYSIWTDRKVISAVLLAIYLIHIIHYQRKDIGKFINYGVKKLFKKENNHTANK